MRRSEANVRKREEEDCEFGLSLTGRQLNSAHTGRTGGASPLRLLVGWSVLMQVAYTGDTGGA